MTVFLLCWRQRVGMPWEFHALYMDEFFAHHARKLMASPYAFCVVEAWLPCG